MRRLFALVCLPLLLGFAPTQEPPERNTSVWACGFAFKPPENLREWRDRADLVIRVRIDSQTAFEYQRGAGPEHVVTAHEATVLEQFKGDPRAVAAGASQQVLQFGGTLRRPDAILKQTWNGFPPMPVGTEWVLFLEWSTHLNGFMPLLIDHGAVQLVDGKVATKLRPEWNGKPTEEFLRAMREAG